MLDIGRELLSHVEEIAARHAFDYYEIEDAYVHTSGKMLDIRQELLNVRHVTGFDLINIDNLAFPEFSHDFVRDRSVNRSYAIDILHGGLLFSAFVICLESPVDQEKLGPKSDESSSSDYQ